MVPPDIGRRLHQRFRLRERVLHVLRFVVLIDRLFILPPLDEAEIARIGRILEQIALVTAKLAAGGRDQGIQNGLECLLLALLRGKPRDHVHC